MWKQLPRILNKPFYKKYEEKDLDLFKDIIFDERLIKNINKLNKDKKIFFILFLSYIIISWSYFFFLETHILIKFFPWLLFSLIFLFFLRWIFFLKEKESVIELIIEKWLWIPKDKIADNWNNFIWWLKNNSFNKRKFSENFIDENLIPYYMLTDLNKSKNKWYMSLKSIYNKFLYQLYDWREIYTKKNSFYSFIKSNWNIICWVQFFVTRFLLKSNKTNVWWKISYKRVSPTFTDLFDLYLFRVWKKDNNILNKWIIRIERNQWKRTELLTNLKLFINLFWIIISISFWSFVLSQIIILLISWILFIEIPKIWWFFSFIFFIIWLVIFYFFRFEISKNLKSINRWNLMNNLSDTNYNVYFSSKKISKENNINEIIAIINNLKKLYSDVPECNFVIVWKDIYVSFNKTNNIYNFNIDNYIQKYFKFYLALKKSIILAKNI